MTEFKFFRYNHAGLIDAGEYLRLADDTAALAHARAVAGGQRIEIWAGARRVAVLPPTRASGAADA